MAIAFVQQSASTGQWAGTSTATPGALPTGATATNLLIAPFGHEQYDGDTQGITALGFSAANSVIDSVRNIAQAGCLYKVSVGGETNATFTNTTTGSTSNSFGDVIIAEFSGLDATSPYVAADSNGASASGATALSVSSSNPLSENSGLAVASFTSDASMTGPTWPQAGWISLLNDLGGNQCGIAYLIFSSNAQLTAAISGITTAANIAATITIFKSASIVPVITNPLFMHRSNKLYFI